MYDNNGLNGFLGRWFKKALGLAVDILSGGANLATGGMLSSVVSGLKNQLTSFVDDLGSGGSTFWAKGTVDTEPTVAEQAILDNWLSTKFLPFYKAVLLQAENALLINNVASKIDLINNVQVKIAVAQAYFKDNDIQGLSANAIAIRNELIAELITQLREAIKPNLTSYTFGQQWVVPVASDFASIIPVFNIAQIQAVQYSVITKVSTSPSTSVNSLETILQAEIMDQEVLNEEPESIDVDKYFTWLSRGILLFTAIGIGSQLFKKKK